MASDGQSIEQLRDYLRKVEPEARSMFLQELERNLLRGDDDAGNGLVLQELRRAIRADAQSAPRIGNAARLFFTRLEPFLIDARADHKRIGRIARAGCAVSYSAMNAPGCSPKPPRLRCTPPPSESRRGPEPPARGGGPLAQKRTGIVRKLPRRGSHCGRNRVVL